MPDKESYRIKSHNVGSPEYLALRDMGMELTDHPDKQGFDLVVPPKKYFIAEVPQLPGLFGDMLDIRAQNNGSNVARLYGSDTIAFDEAGAIVKTWSVSIEQTIARRPETPRKGGHLKLVSPPDKK